MKGTGMNAIQNITIGHTKRLCRPVGLTVLATLINIVPFCLSIDVYKRQSYIGLRGSLMYLHISFANRIPFSEFTLSLIHISESLIPIQGAPIFMA